MREIKFRGYNRKNKQWLYGFYLQNRGAHFVCPDEFATGKSWDDYEVEPETVGQFTGLTDRNGKEIYEGDIVATTAHGCRYVEQVVWHENLLGGGYSFDFVGHGCGPACHKRSTMEVIGNIYDNPELLKEDLWENNRHLQGSESCTSKQTNMAKAYCQKLIDIRVQEGYATDAKMAGECLKIMNGEDVPVAIMDEKQGEQKPAEKVEPKFKIEKGKWYVCIKDLLDNYANKAFCEGDTYLSTQDGSLIPSNSNVPFEVFCPDTYFRDWTIQDAKKGDILQANKCALIFDSLAKDIDGNTVISSWYHCNTKTFYGMGTCKPDLWVIEGVTPATKEQRDLLFQKMKEAGYEWDAEKKELKKIEAKPAWSEEDKCMLNNVIDTLKPLSQTTHSGYAINSMIAWLKSIKDKVQPQPKQEWSEEDEYNIAFIVELLYGIEDSDKEYENKCRKTANWLKSLIPHNTWKPSDEQMKALEMAINEQKEEYGFTSLDSLYEQLKAL